MFCPILAIFSSSNSGRTISAYSGVSFSRKGTYQALNGSTASDSPTMRSLKMSKPVVSVSKQNSGYLPTAATTSRSCAALSTSVYSWGVVWAVRNCIASASA